jgi:hypothetical protein
MALCVMLRALCGFPDCAKPLVSCCGFVRGALAGVCGVGTAGARSGRGDLDGSACGDRYRWDFERRGRCCVGPVRVHLACSTRTPLPPCACLRRCGDSGATGTLSPPEMVMWLVANTLQDTSTSETSVTLVAASVILIAPPMVKLLRYVAIPASKVLPVPSEEAKARHRLCMR